MSVLYGVFYLFMLVAFLIIQFMIFSRFEIPANTEAILFTSLFFQALVASYVVVFREPGLLEKKFHRLIRLKEREPPSEKTKGIVALIFLSTAFSSLAFYGSTWLFWNLLGFGLPPAILKKSWKEFSKKEIIVYLAIGITLGVTLRIK